MSEGNLPRSTCLSVMWKNGSSVDVSTVSVDRNGDLLSDVRRVLKVHPVMGEIYWRDDIFDPEVFHAHHRVKNPFEALGDSIATAFVIHGK